jgi:hypothetical protein
MGNVACIKQNIIACRFWRKNLKEKGLLKIVHINERIIKFNLEQSTKAQRGSKGIALLFL